MKSLFEFITPEIRPWIAALGVVIFITTGSHVRIINAMTGAEASRSPAAIGPVMATKDYVDTRIGDLDKLSAQRHIEEVNAMIALSTQVAAQNQLIQTLSNQFMEFAMQYKHAVFYPHFKATGDSL